MKTLTDNPFALGAMAGLVAALLLMGGQQASAFSIVVMALAFASVILAGLRAGAVAAMVAILVAALLVGSVFGSMLVVTNLLLTLAPAGLMSYLANFARPAEEVGGPERALAWYPLADLLFYTAGAVALSTVITVLANPMREQFYGEAFNQIVLMMRELVPTVPIDPAGEDMIRAMIRILWPLVQGAEMVLVIFMGFYIASRLIGSFRADLRPREDIPSALRMHPGAIWPLGAGVVTMAFGGPVGEVGACIAGAFGAGYVMAGYAVFHNLARDKTWRLPGLILAYLLTGLFTLPVAFGFMIAGLVNPRRAMAITPRSGPSGPDN